MGKMPPDYSHRITPQKEMTLTEPRCAGPW
jgi:hypothetical protein